MEDLETTTNNLALRKCTVCGKFTNYYDFILSNKQKTMDVICMPCGRKGKK